VSGQTTIRKPKGQSSANRDDHQKQYGEKPDSFLMQRRRALSPGRGGLLMLSSVGHSDMLMLYSI
jgi:hypothetical protein